VLEATNEAVLDDVPMETLRAYEADGDVDGGSVD
jgi:hypothetical protein